ncbi:putative arginine decarboxylase [Rosa chinensis]|uniref:Putative arginine decarboxylase n=1 Tax=Rosa chinensis TaxID=74649 RepID=A0A2P6QS83_ROSCH|nr:arginine decarboxylase [Rosa chinensis]PRQ37017.1 putative arginine decarboxylase [Rosa chinensis]
MFSVSVFSASSDLSFHLGFRNNWTCGRPSASLSQESSNLEPRKKEVTARSATKDKILLSSSPTTSQQQNATPLVTALKASAEQNAATFHFPGHNRGRAAPDSITELIGLNPFLHDLPELPELDSLFSPEGPILDAQQQAAKLFGSLETWFLVGGTTCGIQAAIMATCSPGDILVLPRNSHISAVSALILSGAVPKYIIPDYNFDWDIAVGVTPSQVETAIKEVKKEGQKAAAVFITSPTYHGICSNLSEITQLCHSHGIPVIVDEAHGAHLGFHPHMPNSAMQQGADIAVQSTHKVLCSLTQSSMLHLSGKLVDREKISRCLQTLQSTSPSYLLLASLDAARAQISEDPETIFERALQLAIEARNMLRKTRGISVLDVSSFPKFPAIDPLRLTIGFRQLGLSGYEADEILYEDHDIICELVETQCITFVITLGTCREHVQKLVSGIKHLAATSASTCADKRKVDGDKLALFADIKTSLIPRDAFFSGKRRVSIEKSLGKVCGELICPYPPGIPVLIPGEIITKKALDYLLHVRSKGAVITGASDSQLSSIIVCNK